MADRIFIARMAGLEETGVYAAGAQIAMAIYLLVSSFNQAYFPWLYRNLRCADESMKYKIVKYTYIYFFTAMLMFVLTWTFSARIFPMPWFSVCLVRKRKK